MATILTKPGHRVTISAKGWICTCSPSAHGNGGARGPRHGAEIHLRSAGKPQRKRKTTGFTGSLLDRAMGAEPACVTSMGCLCAGHAAGLPADEECDTDEERARSIAGED